MKLSTRLTVKMSALVVATAAVVGAIAHHNLETTIPPRTLAGLETHASLIAVGIKAAADNARADVVAMRGAASVVGLIRTHAADIIDPEDGTSEARWLSRLATDFAALLAAKPIYLRYSLLSLAEAGREIVRVDRLGPDGGIHVVPNAELQTVGKASYVEQSAKLAAGEIYVSPIELRRKDGVIEEPHVAVLHIAAPLPGRDGNSFALLVAEIDMGQAFAAARAATGPKRSIYVVNERGDYLVAPDAAGEFGFELSRSARLQDDFPGAAAAVAGDRAFGAVVEDRARNPTPLTIVRFRLAGGPMMAIAESIPYSEITTISSQAATASLFGALIAVLGATGLAAVIARSQTRPLARITAAVQAFARGEAMNAPTEAAGEIGTLARAFVAMADEVSQKVASLARASEERQRIQAELEHHAGRERLLSAVVEGSDDAILAHDLDGTITAWNPAAERLYGYSAQEMIGANSEIVVPPDRLAETREIRQRVLRGEKIDQLETVRIAKSRGRVDVSLSISPVRAPNGAIVGVSKIARDVTENKLAQEKFRLVVEVCPSGIVMTEAGGKIVLVNTATERLFGYRRDEMIGQPVDMLLPTSLQGQHPEHRESFLADPSTRMMGAGRDLRGLRKDGTEVPIEIGLTPIRTRDGLQVLSFVIDISARKRAEQVVISHTQDLKRSNAELEQFAYVAAHDLQEPLRMVASYTELLSQRYRGKLDERADKYIHYAVDGARRMHLLINDLLAYSRVGTQGKKLAPVQSAQVLKGVLEGLKPKITETGAEIVCGQLPMVKADELQLGQLFQNLIGNALKFRSERKPQIYVNAQRRNGEWEFSVADNGIGIDQQYGERIFQMFQRLHERGKYAGNGIGLAIAKKIVERHGGRIWFDCAPERGTVFHFTMPLLREDA